MAQQLTLITPAAVLPVTLEELKLAAGIDTDAADTLLTAYLYAAIEYASNKTNRQLCTATYELSIDSVPDDWIVRLPKSPVAEIVSVKYTDADGDEQTLSTDSYELVAAHQGNDPYVLFSTTPTTDNVQNAIRIRYECGYGFAEDVPTGLRVAIRMLAAAWFRNREGQAENMGAIDALLHQHVAWGFRS